MTPRPLLIAPIQTMLGKLVTAGMARRNRKGVILGTRHGKTTPLDLKGIVLYFRTMWLGIRNYYIKASNYSSLHSIRYVL